MVNMDLEWAFPALPRLVSLIADMSFKMDARRQVEMILLDFSKAFHTLHYR